MHIKKTLKMKIAIYEPLDFKTTYREFIKQVQNEEFKLPGEIPAGDTIETYLDESIKNFLIERAYYALAPKYLQHLIMNKLGNYNANDVRVQDALDFIRERLEKDGLKRLKHFKEKCKFKTFLTSAVYRLLIDLWRHQGTMENHANKYGPEFDTLFEPTGNDPLSRLICLEDEDAMKKAAEALPRVLVKLEAKEKLVLKMKYEKDLNISEIARTLGRTRYKTAQYIKQIERKIAKEIFSLIKKGGSSETP